MQQNRLSTLFGKHLSLDQKSIEFLTQALEKNNQPGFDYIEFKQSLGALEELHIDETTAIRSAFATGSTVGLTKEKLLKTAQHYKEVLSLEKRQFDAALEKQIQQRIKTKEEEIEKLKKQVEEYKIKIQQMQEKIDRSQATINSADEDISAAKEKILATKENFESALQTILNEIDKDVENFNRLL